jgi:uncharacterized membrane protein YhaH (DUF805 family)
MRTKTGPRFTFADLWKWDGRVSRRTYAIVGLVGFAIKNNLDRLIGSHAFGYDVGFFNYWAPLGTAAHLTHLSSTDAKYLLTLLLVSLPFIWVGVALTVRRLRDAGQPLWSVTLFFVPFVNLLFFLVLCFLPSKAEGPQNEAAPWPNVRPIDRMIPRGRVTSALVSIGLTSAIGLGFSVFGTSVDGSYGWSLFVALPFCMGLFSVLLYSYHAPRDLDSCLALSLLPVCLLAVALIGIAVEGVICILMTAPLALALSALGGGLGYYVQRSYWGRTNSPAMLSIILLAVPGFFGVEHVAAFRPETYIVRSSIEVSAPPEQVWKQVVAFAEISAPAEMLFRAGIAYPIRAEIYGHGPGAVRRCVFSTGSFVEPIQVWDEPHLLRFGVTASPAPLNELTPYGHIDPPHLHGYFVSEEGQFLLTALPNGRTRLEGTTWYRNAMWPAAYWHLWSDYIIHRIHMRVLQHISEEVERSAAAAGGAQAEAARDSSRTRR